jgi:predicted CxxxxCH...CXXCH cytochrome family protein
VYCHGGDGGDTQGAPPQDIDQQSDPAKISFLAHQTHLSSGIMPATEQTCQECHKGAKNYVDATTDAGHWLVSDSSKQVAEVSFTGLATGGTWAADTCSNNYCHGDGQVAGSVHDSTTPLDCEGCHSTKYVWTDLSGTHSRHLGVSGITCADCHSDVVNAAGAITTATKHVNGAKDVKTTTAGFTITAPSGTQTEYTCTGTCHATDHTTWSWNGGHPAGYDAPDWHGQDSLFQLADTQGDCTTCHGTDGKGGTSGQSCDSCHQTGWRTDCTYCHGGDAGDTTGVPPSDLDDTTTQSALTFQAHPDHIGTGNALHADWGCEICHAGADTYVDAWTDPDHWFDTTPGVAEVDMSGSESPASTWNAATNQCSNNWCHGTGKATATVTDGTTPKTCSGCHGNPPSTGDHSRHKSYVCGSCHTDMKSTSSTVFSTPNNHINNVKEVSDQTGTAITFTYSGGKWTCNGTCHDSHSNETW